ncbi:MAG: DUF302 domain-containing protein [Saonia sp.]
MDYYFSTILENLEFDKAVLRVGEALKKEGFGVLTEIDMKATFKKKLEVEFYNYKILGACNPNFAHKALLVEDKVGTMLPCNIIVQEKKPGIIEVSAVNPIASMQAVRNRSLIKVAHEVQDRLKKVIAAL